MIKKKYMCVYSFKNLNFWKFLPCGVAYLYFNCIGSMWPNNFLLTTKLQEIYDRSWKQTIFVSDALIGKLFFLSVSVSFALVSVSLHKNKMFLVILLKWEAEFILMLRLKKREILNTKNYYFCIKYFLCWIFKNIPV